MSWASLSIVLVNNNSVVQTQCHFKTLFAEFVAVIKRIRWCSNYILATRCVFPDFALVCFCVQTYAKSQATYVHINLDGSGC